MRGGKEVISLQAILSQDQGVSKAKIGHRCNSPLAWVSDHS